LPFFEAVVRAGAPASPRQLIQVGVVAQLNDPGKEIAESPCRGELAALVAKVEGGEINARPARKYSRECLKRASPR